MKNALFLVLLALFAISSRSETPEQVFARRKVFIDEFLEKYKDSYEKEKITFIKNFFSDEALIITETKELSSVGKEIAPRSTKTRPYKLLIENRTQYIDRLNKIFKKVNKINIGISHYIVVPHRKFPDIYGVYFFQTWESVGDAKNIEDRMPGYVFLMIDFRNNEMCPIMHVRTWQPQSNIKTPTDKYVLEDFRIITY